MPKTKATTNTRPRGKATSRRPVTRQRRDVPIMPLVVGGVFTAIFLVIVVAYHFASSPAPGINGQPVANISCDTGEQLATHFHTHLLILYKGQPVTVPGQIGITSSCFYWIHTHDTSGVIHIEAPKSAASRKFTLGDFFQVWGQPLSKTQVATLSLGPGDQTKVWVNGQPYQGSPAGLQLSSHESVVIQVGPPFTDPPPTYTWDLGQYSQ